MFYQRPMLIIAFIACLLFSLVSIGAAQQLLGPMRPTPVVTPGPDGHIPLDIPLRPPPGSPYENDQQGWINMRNDCQRVEDSIYAHQPLGPEEWRVCTTLRMTVRDYGKPTPATSPTSPAKQPLPTVVPTPGGMSAPQPLSSSFPVGPFGTPFSGGGGDACAVGGNQPPDVAADVSPTQLAQLLNQGFWVFGKTGTMLKTETLNTFWSANSPPPTNLLSDTQIAYEPLAQRWMATTLSVPSTHDNGDLFFAISNTSDATARGQLIISPTSAVLQTVRTPYQTSQFLVTTGLGSSSTCRASIII
jgi:hypothetical protein